MAVPRLLFFPLEAATIFAGLWLSYYTPRPLRVVYFLAVVGTFVAILKLVPADTKVNDYAFGVVGSVWIMRSVDFFICSDPFTAYHWATTTSSKAPRKYASLTPLERVQWCIGLIANTRGIGWNWEIPHTPRRPLASSSSSSSTPPNTRVSKSRYLRHLSTYFLVLYILQDIGRTYLWHVPFVQSDGAAGTALSDMGAAERTVTVGAMTLITFMQADSVYVLLCMIGGATGWFWANPEEWAPMYGSLGESFTLGRFWSRVWHQNVRHPVKVISRTLTYNLLHLPPHSASAGMLHAYTSFLLSAWFHWTAAKVVHPTWGFPNTLSFFVWQAHALVFEAAVIWAGREKLGLGQSPVWRLLGFVWVVAYMVWTAPWYWDECIRAGLVRPESFPVSVIRGAWKGMWEVPMV